MTEREILIAVHELPEAQQCYVTRYLLVEHLSKHGLDAVDDLLPGNKWARLAWSVLAALLGALVAGVAFTAWEGQVPQAAPVCRVETEGM